MHLAFTAEQDALRATLRAYYEGLLDPETRALLDDHATHDATQRRVVKQMAADGWLGIGWPKEWGGQGRGAIDQWIFFDESMRAGAPVPMLTINTVGPTLMEHGTQEQKERFLPAILRGEIHFCIGYSEPDAGTDLASLKTRGVIDGDDLVINGTKIWTSYGDTADYCWLAIRTDPDVKKHRGLSIVAVPMDTPGITPRPLELIGEHPICEVHYEDVRVPVANVIGGLNNGWSLITGQLNHERVTLCTPGMVDRSLTDVRRWAQETKLPDGRRVIDQDWVQLNLARVHAGFEFLRLQNWKVAWDAEGGRLSVEDASTTKVFGTEHYLDAVRLLMEVVGPTAYLKKGAPGTVLASRLEAMYRSLVILTFGGGVNEVQRDLISVFGLGMPMVKR
ncbi:MAG TPA: acyl-CoA dehydrogenase family protein [Mycobacteriales bacterium]|jgi:alkylation response protein AidB-like acyl-CoA dehydrogenase|nr:acyl-CoA dehydrogenase family protein [Mycobacteriales bacterium]